MASRLNPYICFDGNARQAMEFYQQVFGGDLVLNTFAAFAPPDAPFADRIMHGQLTSPSGYTLMGADLPPDDTKLVVGNSMTVSLSGDDGDELRGYWEKLSAAGTVQTPLEKQMWGDEFGACTDQFGVSWLVNIAQPQS